MVLTLLIVYLHQSVHEYSIRNLYNGFHKSGILIALCQNSGFRIAGMMVSTAGIVALCCRNGGSQTPDRWLNESQNTQSMLDEYKFALRENGDQVEAYEEMDVVSQGDEIETECKAQLDALFGKLSQLDIIIMMKKYGFFGEKLSKMEVCDFVITPIFQRLFKEDASIRSRENPVKTVYAKTIKVDKILAELNGKVNMSDIEGKGCLYRYLVDRLRIENSK